MALSFASVFMSCGSTSGFQTSADGKFVITEDSGVIGYYTFDEGAEDNEVVDQIGRAHV